METKTNTITKTNIMRIPSNEPENLQLIDKILN